MARFLPAVDVGGEGPRELATMGALLEHRGVGELSGEGGPSQHLRHNGAFVEKLFSNCKTLKYIFIVSKINYRKRN